MKSAKIIGTLSSLTSNHAAREAAASQPVACFEFRADLLGDVDPDWLRNHFSRPLLYSLRSKSEGGSFEGSRADRRRRLLRAARHFDLVELESDRDLERDLLEHVPVSKRVIAWSGLFENERQLRARFEQLSSRAAHLYKFAPQVSSAGDALIPLAFLASQRRGDVTAFATGPAGFFSRILAPCFGAPVIFASLDRMQTDGEPSVSQLISDYGFPAVPAIKELYGIVGNPVAHSLSPRLHNAAYRALRRHALFVPFQADSFSAFWREVVRSGAVDSLGLSIKGLTVVSPYKEEALQEAASASVMVNRAGATNIFVRENGNWAANTTDPEGVLSALQCRGISVAGKRVAVVGCGGAGRAMAAALEQAGAQVTLVNRGIDRGHKAVELLALPFVPLSKFSSDGYSIVINATPVGRDGAELPFDISGMAKDGVVVDLVYGHNPTPLVSAALEAGLSVVDGREVLLIQVRRQFRMMTGQEMPHDLARNALNSTSEPLQLVTAA